MAADVQFCAVTPAAVLELAKTMRPEDRAEVYRSGFASPLQAVELSVQASEVATAVLFDRKVAAIIGARVTVDGGALVGPLEGVVWVLTGKACDKHPKEYLRHTKALLATLLAWCPVLRNHIDARHAPALRWARWAGLRLGEPVPFGPYGLPFVPFEARR